MTDNPPLRTGSHSVPPGCGSGDLTKPNKKQELQRRLLGYHLRLSALTPSDPGLEIAAGAATISGR